MTGQSSQILSHKTAGKQRKSPIPYTLRFIQHLGTLGNYDKSELGEGATPRKEIDASHFPIRHILISPSRGSLSPPFYAPLTPSPHNGTLG